MAATTPTKKRHRSFSAKKREEAIEELSFDLEGQTFQANEEIPGAVLLDFMAAAGEDGAGTASAIFPFFKEALREGEWDRFNDLIHDKKVNIDMETLVEIVGYLVEAYADSRPISAS